MNIELYLKIISLPLISAAIGWITNKIAVWMLFHPKEPKKFLFLTFQGVFPKRQQFIAKRIGDLVADYLLSTDMIQEQLFSDQNKKEALKFIETKINQYLQEEFRDKSIWLNLLISKKKENNLKQDLLLKIEDILQDLSLNFENYLEKHVNVRALVTEKVSQLDSEEVNEMMNHILHTELRFIEYTGAVLGFLIGILQLLLIEFVF